MASLDGLRVLDLGTFVAAPYCATIMGEHGAEVIKVEHPVDGDSLRAFGTDTECGDTLVWLSESRNKKCITLNLKIDAGKELLSELIAVSDVVVENFRPGVMEKLGFGFDSIQAISERVILVRISGYGQTGPYAKRPGFARVAHGFAGLAYLSGEPGRTPVVPGSTSLADYMAGAYGALGAMMALRVRDQTGIGQCIDLALYEPIFRVLDEMAPSFERHGFVRERMGADTVNVAPHSHYQSADGRWLAIACTSDRIFARLADAMGQPELAALQIYGTKKRRVSARCDVNRIVGNWTASLSAEEVLRRCNDAGVPAGPINSVADIFLDPQFEARENISRVDSRVGPLAVPGVVPRLSNTPGSIRWLGAALGEHNREVYCGLLGISGSKYDELSRIGVI